MWRNLAVTINKANWMALLLAILTPSAAAQSTQPTDRYQVITNQQVHSIARRSSQELNTQLPMAVDSQTRADTSVVGPGRRFTYLLTFTQPSSTSETAADLDFAPVRNRVCSTTALKLLVDNDYLIIYKYFDINGRFIGDVAINRSDCLAPRSTDLATRVANGDVSAFREALMLAKERPDPRKLSELADMISKFVTVNPEEFLRAQLEPYPGNINLPCFGVNYYGADYFLDVAAEAIEAARRGYKLSTVDAPELQQVKELCLAKLNGPDA
jgi:hypothetical protein